VPAHYLKDVIIVYTPENDDRNQVENPPSRLSLLAVPLKGCDLLNIGTVLVFGTWKVLLSGHDGLVVLTKVELVLLMIAGFVYAFFILASGGRDQTCRADCPSQIILRQDARETRRNLPRFLRSQFGPSHLEIYLSF